MTEGVIGGHQMEKAAGSPEVEVDRLVEQLPQHLVEQEPLLGPLLATHRPNTEVTTFLCQGGPALILQVVYTVTQHCRETVIDMVEEEWQGELEKEAMFNENFGDIENKEEERLTEKDEIENSQMLMDRPSLGSMEATVQRVGIFDIVYLIRKCS